MKPLHILALTALLGVGFAMTGAAMGDEPGGDKKDADPKPADAAKSEDTEGSKKADEAATESENAAPAFELKDTNGKAHKLSQYRDKWVVLEWINHDCPFVKKQYRKGHMQALQEKYTAKKVVWLSICSSAEGKQGHMTPEKWNETIEQKKSKATAVLLDADGKVGKLYEAKVTPTMVVISPKGEIVYQGAIDSIRSADPDDIEFAENYVAQVLDAVLDGKKPPITESTAYG
jgi:peroxiredoxin